jgi:hypothetical protein
MLTGDAFLGVLLDWFWQGEWDRLVHREDFYEWNALALRVCPGDLAGVIVGVTGAECAPVAVEVCPALPKLTSHDST